MWNLLSVTSRQFHLSLKICSFFFQTPHLRQCGVLATLPPKAANYDVQRDHRKLHLELLHLPPEESCAMSSSNRINGSSTISSSTSTTISVSAKMANFLSLTAQGANLEQQRQESSHPHDYSRQHSHSLRSSPTAGIERCWWAAISRSGNCCFIRFACTSARAARAAAATSVAAVPLHQVRNELRVDD